MTTFTNGTPGYSGAIGNYRRGCILQMSSALNTPTVAPGYDYGSLKVIPYDIGYDSNSASLTWTVVSIWLRVEAAGTSATAVKIGHSTGTSAFSNVGFLNNTTALTVGSGSYEAYLFTSGLDVTTVSSGDKIMAYYTTLGSGATNYSLVVSLRA